jgi:hypothetical protein
MVGNLRENKENMKKENILLLVIQITFRSCFLEYFENNDFYDIALA